MIETALFVCEKSFERCCPVHPGRRPAGLEAVDPNFFGRVHVVARLRKKRRNMAACTLSLALENRFTPGGGAAMFGTFIFPWFWSRNGELVEMKGGEFRSDQIRIVSNVV